MMNALASKYESKKALYAFNWKQGGYNQVYASSKLGAIAQVRANFSSLDMDESSLRRLNRAEEINYWRAMPVTN